MNRLTLTTLAFALIVGSWAQAQAPKPAAHAAQATQATQAAALEAKGDAATLPTPEDLIARRAVPYRPTITRDPFSAPSDAEPSNRGDLVDDIAVKGVIKREGRFFAVVSDSRGNVRFLPSGYKFRDGEIASVDDKAVTFHQWDPNSTVRTQFKTITKTFKREEGKR